MLNLLDSNRAQFIEHVKEVCRFENLEHSGTGQKRKAQSLSYVISHLRDKGWKNVSNLQPDDFFELGFDCLVSEQNPNRWARHYTAGPWVEDRGYRKVKLGRYHVWIAQREG